MAKPIYPCDSISGCFYAHGRPLAAGPVWGMSLRAAGSMRFRWAETNPRRDAFLAALAGSGHEIAAVELVHSRVVYALSGGKDCLGKQGDGIITQNKKLIPVVTAADCLPIFLYNPQAEVFGALHSGWRGTGIVKNALELARSRYGARAEDFCAVLAPHIRNCCYTVDRERADYFASAFGGDCVLSADGGTSFRLSLAAANLHILKDCGVIEENIYVSPHCTCCNTVFGSFRREHPLSGSFTVQATWVKYDGVRDGIA